MPSKEIMSGQSFVITYDIHVIAIVSLRTSFSYLNFKTTMSRKQLVVRPTIKREGYPTCTCLSLS